MPSSMKGTFFIFLSASLFGLTPIAIIKRNC